MTDTTAFLAMLNAARALHERCPHDLGNCATCHTEEWPCPTATALGATGRSEWTTPPTGTQPPEPDKCGSIRTQPDDNYGDFPCVLPAGHPHGHADRDGDRW